jgi:hypothetical protein
MFAPVFLVGAAVFVAVGGLVVRALWNWLLPPLFGLPAITFWQALGILALCRILFGQLSMRGGSRYDYRRRMEERWKSMTPEERERFRNSMWGRFGAAMGSRQPWHSGPATGESEKM